jgi:Outer membrane protein beta-barrel domain
MKTLKILAPLFSLGLLVIPQLSNADGCAPGQPCWKKKPKAKAKAAMEAPLAPTPTPAAPAPVVTPEPVKADSKMSVGLGVNVLFFDCEDPTVAPGIRVNYGIADMPLNLQVGFEGANIDSVQYKFARPHPFGGKNPDITFLRLPVSLEYVIDVAENTGFYLGGGPDLFHIDGEGTDTDVGGHLGARVQHNITDTLGLSVETGYLWAEAKQRSVKTDLDSAYVGTHVMYNF